jgi:Tfp pilus assembly protein PilX
MSSIDKWRRRRRLVFVCVLLLLLLLLLCTAGAWQPVQPNRLISANERASV